MKQSLYLLLILVALCFGFTPDDIYFLPKQTNAETYYWDSTFYMGVAKMKVTLVRNYNQSTEIGEIIVDLYEVKENREKHLWNFSDRKSCDWQDVVAYLNFNKVLVQDVDGDKSLDLVFVYTLDCTTDVSPVQRVLVYHNILKDSSIFIEGFSLDPATSLCPSFNDLIYNSETIDVDNVFYTLCGKMDEINTADLTEKELKSIKKIWHSTNKIERKDFASNRN